MFYLIFDNDIHIIFCIFAVPSEGEVQVTLGLPNGFLRMAFSLGIIDMTA